METANVLRGLQDDTLNPELEAPPPPDEAPNRNAKSPVRRRNRRRRRRNKWCPCLYVFIIPPLTLIGGFVFLLTEKDRNDSDIQAYKNRCAAAKSQKTQELLQKINATLQRNAGNTSVNDFMNDINETISEVDQCLRSDENQQPYVYDFVGSMVFSASLFATIGYGDLVPVTVGGRIATLFYSMVGVPIYISFCADLSEWASDRITSIATAARNAYRRKNLGRRLTKEEAEAPLSQTTIFLIVLTMVAVYSASASAIVMASVSTQSFTDNAVQVVEDSAGGKQWSYLDALYFFHISITLIGFGDLTPTHEYYLCVHLPLIIVGQTLLALVFYCIQKVIRYRIPKWITAGCISMAHRYDSWVRDRKGTSKAEEDSSGSTKLETQESQLEMAKLSAKEEGKLLRIAYYRLTSDQFQKRFVNE